MPRWWGCAGVLFVVLLALGPHARADDETTGALRGMKNILDVLEQGDTGVLPAFGNTDNPDPWLVAFELCQAGHADEALALAQSVERLEIQTLPAQVQRWKDAPLLEEDVTAWRAMQVAYETRRFDDVVKAGPDDPPKGSGFHDAWVGVYGGMARYSTGDPAVAKAWLVPAAKKADALGWAHGSTSALFRLGHAHRQLGEFEEALDVWTRCAVLWDRRKVPLNAATVRVNIAAMHQELSDYRPAIALLEAAIRIFEEKGVERHAPYLIQQYQNLGWVREAVGPYANALTAFQACRRLADEIDFDRHVVNADIGLATIYTRLGDWEEAEKRARAALTKAREIEHATGIGSALGTLGLLYTESARFDMGLSAYEQARAAFEAIRDDERSSRDDRDEAQAHVARVIVNLGTTYTGLGRHDEARASFEQALELFGALERSPGTIGAYLGLAWLEFVMGDYAKAAKTYNHARLLASDLEMTESLIEVHRGLAETKLAQGRFAAALTSARAAIDILTTAVRGLEPRQQVQARAYRSRVFEIGMLAAAALGDVVAFSDSLERARAFALLEMLEDPHALREALIPGGLLVAEEAARTREAAARRRLELARQAGDLKRARTHRAELHQAQADVQKAIDEIQRTAKAGADLLYPASASLPLIRDGLGKRDVLVRYAAVPEAMYAAVTTRDETRIVDLGDPVDIEVAARDVMQQSSDARSDPTKAWARLRALVIEPLALPKDVGRLLIAPDGPLFFVPLAALIGIHDTVHVASGTMLIRLAGSDEGRGTGVLAIGDPVYRDARRLTPLPGSRREVEAIGTEVLVGKDATERRFEVTLRKTERWRAVHFAGHGLIDVERPMMSSLALTAGPHDDGYLTCLEILRMRISAELAVLSACETAKGAVFRSEGLVGMTRAFMAAGSPRVLCSLWKVDDEATRELMFEFYKRWDPRDGTSGVDAAKALRQAQTAIRDHPDHRAWKHPYYWAAWTVWGLP